MLPTDYKHFKQLAFFPLPKLIIVINKRKKKKKRCLCSGYLGLRQCCCCWPFTRVSRWGLVGLYSFCAPHEKVFYFVSFALLFSCKYFWTFFYPPPHQPWPPTRKDTVTCTARPPFSFSFSASINFSLNPSTF